MTQYTSLPSALQPH